jgi:sec-independent protein translocase protein TatC
MAKLRPIGHEDRLSIIDHLDELRGRLIICGVALFVAFGICFWQNGALIDALNRALPPAATSGLGAQQNVNAALGKEFAGMQKSLDAAGAILKDTKSVPPAVGTYIQQAAAYAGRASKTLPKDASAQAKPVTLGVGESFTTTLLVVGYFALLFTLPLLLYQAYAFILPALSGQERRIAIPTMIAAPVLFTAGAVFTFFAILPPAIHFLQGYNSNQFQILVQAKTYYKFEIILMLGIGLAFQIPLGLLALQKVGVITASTLSTNWRYATVLIAIAAAALPGVDPVTMAFETLPLVLLYLASIVLLRWVEYRARKRSLAEAAMPQSDDDDSFDS